MIPITFVELTVIILFSLLAGVLIEIGRQYLIQHRKDIHQALREKLNDVDMRTEAVLTPEEMKAAWDRIEQQNKAKGISIENPYMPKEYEKILEDMEKNGQIKSPLDFAWDEDRFQNTTHPIVWDKDRFKDDHKPPQFWTNGVDYYHWLHKDDK